MNESHENRDMILGRLLALTTEINDKISRLVWRIDDLEKRMEVLENARHAGTFSRQFVERFIWAVVVAGGVAFGVNL